MARRREAGQVSPAPPPPLPTGFGARVVKRTRVQISHPRKRGSRSRGTCFVCEKMTSVSENVNESLCTELLNYLSMFSCERKHGW